VTVRIRVVDGSPLRRIAVDGRLSHDEVEELEHAVGSPVENVCLDLANLRGADAAGLDALARLQRAGVELRGLSPHLAWQIGASRR
jgi:ABC-type transporter Mla MlaB component